MAGSGQFYSFSESVTPKRTISDTIDIIDPRDIPCQSFFGVNNQDKFGLENFPNHKYAWLEDSLRPRTATLSGGVNTTATAIPVTTGHGLRFAIDDVWKSEETGELILVTAVNGTDTVQTVVRNYTAAVGGAEGTAAASLTTGLNLTFLYNVRMEGADATDSRWDTPAEVFNYSTIMFHYLKESGSSENATTRYGIDNWQEYEISKALGGDGASKTKKGKAGDLLINLENMFFGRQIKTQRSSTVRGVTAGARTLITTNVVSTAQTLTQPLLEDTIALCDAAGGMPDTIICNQFQWRLICSWFKDSVRRTEDETTAGVVIENIRTIFGEMNIMYNRRCPAADLYILQKEKVGYVTLRDWAIEPLGKTGDSTRQQITGEFGLVVKTEKAHALMTNLATS